MSSSLPADEEIGVILSDPALHAEVRAVLPSLEQRGLGGGVDAVKRALAPLVLVYGLGEQSKSALFWQVYADTLKDIPADSLQAAAKVYVMDPDANFFPKPGPLRALALKHAEPIWKARDRARRAANSLPRPTPTPDDIEARKAMAAQVLASLGSRPA